MYICVLKKIIIMKKIFNLILILFLSISFVTGQTAFSSLSTASNRGDEIQAFEASAANAWIGAKLSYTFDEDVDFKDNFLFNARFVYTIKTKWDKLHLPVVSNVSFNLGEGGSGGNFIYSGQGISLGLHPYYILSQGSSIIIPYGSITYRMNPIGDNLDNSSQQLRVLGGVELAFYGNNDKPFTFALAPALNFNNNGFGTILTLPITSVLPVANGTGLLIDFEPALTKSTAWKSVFKVGVIVHGIL